VHVTDIFPAWEQGGKTARDYASGSLQIVLDALAAHRLPSAAGTWGTDSVIHWVRQFGRDYNVRVDEFCAELKSKRVTGAQFTKFAVADLVAHKLTGDLQLADTLLKELKALAVVRNDRPLALPKT
jgi:hypothetical protein